MKVGQFATQLKYPLMAACMIVCFSPASALAQGDHADMKAADSRPQTATEKDKATALVKAVRDATARFRDVTVAESEDYVLKFGCVSGSDFGAMGVHFVNFALVGDGAIDIKYPELLVYEPAKNGHLNLVAADYLVDRAAWDAHNPAPPELNGQLFHLFDAPNRFGLDPFYTLHVWAWKDNPNGMFTNWNPNVSCDNFIPRDSGDSSMAAPAPASSSRRPIQ